MGGTGSGSAATTDRVAAARALLPPLQGGENLSDQAWELVEAARAAADGPGECAALYSAMAAAALQADGEGSRQAAERLAQRAADHGLPAWEATGLQYQARRQLADGHEDLALSQIVTCELLVDDAAPDIALVVALNGLAVAYSRIGMHEDSERTNQRLAEVVFEAGDEWAVHAFVHNRQLNQAAWGVSLAQAGFAEEAQDRLVIASEQARSATDMTSSTAYDDFLAMCLFADLMAGVVSLEEAKPRLDAALANALGEPQSYLRFACAHQLSTSGRWEEARAEVKAGLAAVNPNEQEPIRSALRWERARIAKLEYPDHPGVAELWDFAQDAGARIWQLRQRRREAVHGKLRVARLTREHERMERVTLEDPLTGAANRRRIDRERASLLSEPATGWVTVCYLDVDRFKQANDRFGHELGDTVLREVATLLEDHVRDGDLVGRYGGDEFVVLAAHCPPEDAQKLSERMLAAIREHPWDELDPGLDIRVSIGMACTRSGFTQLFPAADEALYRAKRGGRDRAEITVIDGPRAPENKEALATRA